MDQQWAVLEVELGMTLAKGLADLTLRACVCLVSMVRVLSCSDWSWLDNIWLSPSAPVCLEVMMVQGNGIHRRKV